MLRALSPRAAVTTALLVVAGLGLAHDVDHAQPLADVGGVRAEHGTAHDGGAALVAPSSSAGPRALPRAALPTRPVLVRSGPAVRVPRLASVDERRASTTPDAGDATSVTRLDARRVAREGS